MSTRTQRGFFGEQPLSVALFLSLVAVSLASLSMWGPSFCRVVFFSVSSSASSSAQSTCVFPYDSTAASRTAGPSVALSQVRTRLIPGLSSIPVIVPPCSFPMS